MSEAEKEPKRKTETDWEAEAKLKYSAMPLPELFKELERCAIDVPKIHDSVLIREAVKRMKAMEKTI